MSKKRAKRKRKGPTVSVYTRLSGQDGQGGNGTKTNPFGNIAELTRHLPDVVDFPLSIRIKE